MTDIFEQAVEALRKMPTAERDSIAQAIVSLAGHEVGPLDVESDHLPFVLEGLAQIERGEFAEGEPEEIVARAFERARRAQ
jgi:hypothetical protein